VRAPFAKNKVRFARAEQLCRIVTPLGYRWCTIHWNATWAIIHELLY